MQISALDHFPLFNHNLTMRPEPFLFKP